MSGGGGGVINRGGGGLSGDSVRTEHTKKSQHFIYDKINYKCRFYVLNSEDLQLFLMNRSTQKLDNKSISVL